MLARLVVVGGLLAACSGSGTSQNGAVGGTGGSGGAGASSAQGGEPAQQAGSGAGQQPSGSCPDIAPAGDGAGIDALSVLRGTSVLGISARCDGSFVAVGSGKELTFPGRDGAMLTTAAIPEAPLGEDPGRLAFWIASFDSQGKALWTSAYWSGRNDGSGSDAHPILSSDGSVLLGGVYSGSVTLALGQPSEETLADGAGVEPEAYVARFDSGGELSWVRGLTDEATRDNRTHALATASDGTAFALFEIGDNTPDGFVLAPGELDLDVVGGDVVLAALDTDGQFINGVRITSARYESPAATLTTMADGDMAFVLHRSAGSSIAPGTAEESSVAEVGDYLLRFSPTLGLRSATLLPLPGSYVPLSDGSVLRRAGAEAVSRLDGDGNVEWTVQVSHPELTGPGESTGLEDGSVWITGTLGKVAGSLELSGEGASSVTLDTTEQTQAYIARIAPDGTPSWAVPVGGDRNFQLERLAATPRSLLVGGRLVAGTSNVGSGVAALDLTGPGIGLVRLGP